MDHDRPPKPARQGAGNRRVGFHEYAPLLRRVGQAWYDVVVPPLTSAEFVCVDTGQIK